MNTTKPVVLVAPLDWGLGHTMRCIPIIRELLAKGCRVIVACDSRQKQILHREFPTIQYTHLAGYNIRYGKTRLHTLLSISLQAPKILIRIKTEYRWITKFLLENHVDAIISDNRYGIYSDDIPSIFVTHQPGILSGLGKMVDSALQTMLSSYIRKFSVCWIPDWMNPDLNAGGQLSHPTRNLNLSSRYIGCLSRLENCNGVTLTMDLLVVLSGPEPQRTILEKIILCQLKTYVGSAVVVRGAFDKTHIPSFGKIRIVDNASSAEMNELLCQAKTVISRAGYTTVMDMLKLRKKAILIPTPGQAEQEYLGVHLMRKKLAYSTGQENFHLDTAIKNCLQFEQVYINEPMDLFKSVIDELVRSLEAGGVNRRA